MPTDKRINYSMLIEWNTTQQLELRALTDKYQKLAIKWKKASYKDYNEY